MSILATSLSASAPTKDQLLERKKKSIEDLTSRTFQFLLRSQKDGIRLLWGDRDLSPQEIIDYLGADVVQLFTFHGQLTDFIKNIAALDGTAVNLAAPTNAFTVDSKTGKISVTTDPYVAD